MTERDRPGWIPRAASRILRTRWIVRAPIYLYKWRLGGIFGSRLLMIEHTGRKSGRSRYTVVEIIDRRARGFVIASGFGKKAQWYRNILADPQVHLYLGSHRPVAGEARPLSPAEASASLEKYADRFPNAWATLKPVLEDTLGAEIDEHETNLPMMLVVPS